MSCRLVRVAVFAVALGPLGGCTDEAPTVDVSATATMSIMLGPDRVERLVDEEATYRWELVSAPEASTVVLPAGTAVLSFVPDARGVYLVERWLEYGLSEHLTHRFVIDAAGVPPRALAGTDAVSSVGSAFTLDGSASYSDEGLTLIYRWRLTSRPQGSSTVLAGPETVTSLLTPDVAGKYTAELAVFDGVLWGTPDSMILTAQ
jgi:hypothetical protein